jgi:ERCC4-type nuclease
MVCDSREPKWLQRALTLALGEAQVEVRALPCADFLLTDKLGGQVGIERKTVGDLLGSLASPRLARQLEAMDRAYPVRILILEGSFALSPDGKMIIESALGDHLTRWHHASYQMAVLSLQHRHGFYLLPTSGLTSTVDTLRVLHNHVSSRIFNPRICHVAEAD